MPRSHVSVARFYDWSEDLSDCVSVSKFYRDLAFGGKNSNKLPGKNNWCSNGVHISPGRMFLRDKAGLTKGEKEIIEGIYRNRGDVRDMAAVGQTTKSTDEWHVVRSHKDAWLIGKQNNKSLPRSSDSIDSLKLPDNLFSRSVEKRDMCASFVDSLPSPIVNGVNSGSIEQKPETMLIAPPTTPDKELSSSEMSDSLSSSTPRRVYQCGEGSVLVDPNRNHLYTKHNNNVIKPLSQEKQRQHNSTKASTHKQSSPSVMNPLVQERPKKLTNEKDDSISEDKRKVFVNVFLPQPSNEISRETTSVSRDRTLDSPLDIKYQLKNDAKRDTVGRNTYRDIELPSVKHTHPVILSDPPRRHHRTSASSGEELETQTIETH